MKNTQETTVHDPLAALPPALRKHAREYAVEMGIDPVEYRSNERAITLPDGRKCESWYDEGACRWRAFVAGVGTRSGDGEYEAIVQHCPGLVLRVVVEKAGRCLLNSPLTPSGTLEDVRAGFAAKGLTFSATLDGCGTALVVCA